MIRNNENLSPLMTQLSRMALAFESYREDGYSHPLWSFAECLLAVNILKQMFPIEEYDQYVNFVRTKLSLPEAVAKVQDMALRTVYDDDENESMILWVSGLRPMAVEVGNLGEALVKAMEKV